jgi:Rod binding domain-containing protein
VIKLNNTMPYLNTDAASGLSTRAGNTDISKAASQVEEVFLNELLKSMFQNTELAKDKIIGNYLPYITAEVSKSLSKRGIGIKEFFMRSPAFNMMVEKGQVENIGSAGTGTDAAIKASAIKAYGAGFDN